MSIKEQQFISTEEWDREWRRLSHLGLGHDSPEFAALARRVTERDDYLFSRYGRHFVKSHPGQWIAISMDGDVLVKPTAGEVVWAATEAWGPGNFMSRRLAEFPGHRIAL